MSINNKLYSKKFHKVIEWLIHMIGYTVAFLITIKLFKSVHINGEYRYLISFIVVVILSILNKTIKPVLVRLTIPITGLTLGLFYPFINALMLKITDWIMGKYFELTNIYVIVFLAILLSITHFISEEIINSIIKKVKKHE